MGSPRGAAAGGVLDRESSSSATRARDRGARKGTCDRSTDPARTVQLRVVVQRGADAHQDRVVEGARPALLVTFSVACGAAVVRARTAAAAARPQSDLGRRPELQVGRSRNVRGASCGPRMLYSHCKSEVLRISRG